MNGDPSTENAPIPTLETTPTHDLTSAQQSVLNALRQQPQPVSAQALHEFMCARYPIGLATVYRSLDTLKLLGLIQHRLTLNGEMLYCLIEDDFYYATCLKCGISTPLQSNLQQQLSFQLKSNIPFHVYYHSFESFGICNKCFQH